VVEALRILRKYVDVFEEADPQFKSVKRIAKVHGPKVLGVVVGNALVSYRLKGTGEEYWTEFGEFFLEREPTYDNLVRFLESSRYNIALRNKKLQRLQRVKSLIQRLSADPQTYTDLNYLIKQISFTLGAKGTEKTIVFAAKMAYYMFKSLGIETRGDVPIPIDSRIATVTCASRMVDACPDDIMNKYKDEAVRVWREVAEKAGVRTLNLDALIWLPAKGLRRALCSSLEAGKKKFLENLKALGVAEAQGVTELLIRRKCC